MPKLFIYLAIIGASILLIPPAIVARLRAMNSDKPRIHIIQDMDNQARYRFQQTGPFNDQRAMRRPVDGTVARGELRGDDHYDRGSLVDGFVTTYPAQITVDRALLERGRERFDIYCALCHGYAGYGDGIVHQRAMELVLNPAISKGTTWVQPKNLHEPEIRVQPPGEIYNSITNGVRNMAGYAAQIPTADRWAITAYVKALQRSQSAEARDVPAGRRGQLETIDLVPVAEGDE